MLMPTDAYGPCHRGEIGDWVGRNSRKGAASRDRHTRTLMAPLRRIPPHSLDWGRRNTPKRISRFVRALTKMCPGALAIPPYIPETKRGAGLIPRLSVVT